MKILMINVTCGTGSTGRICTDLAEALEKEGHIVKIAYGRDAVPEKYNRFAVRIGKDYEVGLHVLKSRLLDASGFGSIKATLKFIKWVDEYNPDVIHLHNIHGYYISINVLFEYLKKLNKRIIWTLHDCWSFTGHTPYCDVINCEKWRQGCSRCELLNEYPKSLLGFSKRNWLRKKNLFTGLSNMSLVTPSEWLKLLVEKSFLGEYKCCVINNGIDTKIFYHRENNILDKYGINGKFVLLGVASVWDHMKGFEDYINLSKMLDDSIIILLVGVTKKQILKLPNNIVGIERTESVEELADLYSSADLFINLSRCENYPTVNIEALACGTPVLTYKTGGSPEIVNRNGGIVVEKNNLSAVKVGIMQSIAELPSISFNPEENDISSMIEKYMKLYKV